uniref:RNA-dependent RNA polymerase n=1 Tax=Mlepnos solemo-like virus TaxID=2716737 RepID=A0A6G7PSU2_9VIRU|nr:RNA-dependent RNA polymerase [Mlepnos solemo-like virus]
MPSSKHVRNPNIRLNSTGYGWPETDCAAIKRSFAIQLEYRKRAEGSYRKFTKRERAFAISWALKRNKITFDAPRLDDLDYEIRRALRTLDPRSSTGLGVFESYPTIGDALGWNGFCYTSSSNLATLAQYVKARINCLCSEDYYRSHFTALSQGSESSQRMRWRRYAPDAPTDVKLFVKDEPHKDSKIVEGRYRLISCFSLVDQVVDKILFGRHVQSSIDNFGSTSTKGGWAPFPGGYKELLAQFPLQESAAVDKTAWDQTFHEATLKLCLEIFFSQCRNPTARFRRAVYSRVMETMGCAKVYRFPDGTRYRQNFIGRMESGWTWTLHGNSLGQEVQHLITCYRVAKELGKCAIALRLLNAPPLAWIIGDDVLMKWLDIVSHSWLLDLYHKHLNTTGCIAKFVKNTREFAGYAYLDKERIVPIYPNKHKFALMYVHPDQEQEMLESYFMLYSMTPDFGWLNDFRTMATFPVGRPQVLWAKGMASYHMRTPQWLFDKDDP